MWVISLLLAEVQLKVKFSSRVQFFICLFYLLETSILRCLNIAQVQIYMEHIPPWSWETIIPCQGPLAICATDRE